VTVGDGLDEFARVGQSELHAVLLFVQFDVTRRSQFALIAIARAVSPDLQQALMHAMSNAATNPRGMAPL
jgi:hypothetical protein